MIELKFDDGDIIFLKNIKRIRFNEKENIICIYDECGCWEGKVDIVGWGFNKNNLNFVDGTSIENANSSVKVMLSLTDEHCLILKSVNEYGNFFKEGVRNVYHT